MVRAPVDGTILKKNVEEGNMVNNGISLCDLANLNELEVELAIPERDIGKIKPGQRCKIHTEAFPDRFYEGIVSRVLPVADRGRSAIPIRVKIAVPGEEEGNYLRPEMTAFVSFQGGETVAQVNEGGKASSPELVRGRGVPSPLERPISFFRPTAERCIQ
jgi:multidrug efflux pump subunit AcrA (membrane-fusion protein)